MPQPDLARRRPLGDVTAFCRALSSERRRSATVKALRVALSGGIIAASLAGCAATTSQEEASVLPSIPITELLPTTEQYADLNGDHAWSATTSLVTEDLYGRLSLSGTSVSAVDYGESCAKAFETAGAVDATIKEAATQEIGINGTDEFATLIRYDTVEQTKSVFDAQVDLLKECSKNEGTAVFTPVEVKVENTVAYNSRTPHTDDDFIGFGRRGDLLVIVTNTNADATEVGPKTIRYIMGNLAEKVAGSN
ncbi:hypothetical protein ITJ43_14270 [Microbacterium sp. VKM Ac-2870]|uniref:hypothetical protein n=1 Tax=Microbacterium sp. VKM Ac-2870 TaxID=2783825 RepID=UPI00188B9117|nr:hypothetical protein [Microbacterium sp. VKM Ac-2870]MBF4563296.1 hypothetical protein [Microbacterium sp. VKM Ac-2870]